MKRDFNLIRKLLLSVQNKEPVILNPAAVYHCELLCQGELIEVSKNETYQLTAAGHQFLNLARDESVWSAVTRRIQEKAGSVPFELLMKLLQDAAKNKESFAVPC